MREPGPPPAPQPLLLAPLVELSAVPHPDTRARQLECVLALLHGAAEKLQV